MPTPIPISNTYRRPVHQVALIFVTMLLFVPLGAARCGAVTGPSASGMACRIEEYRTPAKARDDAGQIIVYATVANYCTDPTQVDHLVIKVWLQREHSDGHWFRAGETLSEALGRSRIATTAQGGTIKATHPANRVFGGSWPRSQPTQPTAANPHTGACPADFGATTSPTASLRPSPRSVKSLV